MRVERVARLSRVLVGRVDAGRDRAREVGVVENHEGRLAAELERDLFHRVCGQLGDALPGARGTGERHHVDVGMRGEGLADDGTETADEIEHARREPDFVDDLSEDERVDRSNFRRLEHHGAAGRECVGDFRADLVQRVIPWRDATDDADGLAYDEPVAPVFELERRREFRRRREPGDAATHLGRHRLVLGHADFVADDRGDLVATGFECVGDATQELPARGCGLIGPLGERGLRRRDGGVDVGGVAGRDGGETLLGGGVDHLEHAAPGRRHPRTVDIEVVVLVHESAG